MIKCNLAVLLAERGLKMSDVINNTPLAKNTVRSLFYNEAKGIQFETLEVLCDYLNVTPSEIVVYNPLKYSLNRTGRDTNYLYFDIELSIKKSKVIKGEIDVYYKATEFLFDDPTSVPLELDINIYYSPKIYNEIKQISKLFSSEIEDELINAVLDQFNAIEPDALRMAIFTDVIDYREVEE